MNAPPAGIRLSARHNPGIRTRVAATAAMRTNLVSMGRVSDKGAARQNGAQAGGGLFEAVFRDFGCRSATPLIPRVSTSKAIVSAGLQPDTIYSRWINCVELECCNARMIK